MTDEPYTDAEGRTWYPENDTGVEVPSKPEEPPTKPLDDWNLTELNEKFGLAPKPMQITNREIDEDLRKPRIDDGDGTPPEPPEEPPHSRRLRDGDGEPMEFATGEALLALQAVAMAQCLADTVKIQVHLSPMTVSETVATWLEVCTEYRELTRNTVNTQDQPVFPIGTVPPHFESQTQDWGNPVAGA